MSHVIIDGTGTKKRAQVDSTNKLQTRTVSEPSSIEALAQGNQYILHSAVMNLTSASNSYISYFQNNETNPFVVTLIEISSEKSNEQGTINTKQTAIIRVRRNPSGPSFSQDWFTNNADFSSPNTLSRTAVTGGFGAGGGEGGTFTDSGALVVHDLIQCGTSQILPLEQLVIGTGNAIGIGFQPPTGNTDIDVHINLIGYLRSNGG